jgi:biotin operon repressor
MRFEREEKLRTVWDTFTQQNPGERRALNDSAKTIWDMIDELKAKGLYLAERRED